MKSHPLNLFRVNWFNNRDHTSFLKAPEHIVLPSEFTGIEAKIIVNLGKVVSTHNCSQSIGCLWLFAYQEF